MSGYQVLARRYRPQKFSEVLGQEAIVATLKNAIKSGRLAHAYLFCGSRGTGKTTLARVLAKALNCQHPQEDLEPCNACISCKEITAGHSMDVLEIDGASHRGIDDMRQINDTVGYASASGKYKIYIIDEVHMLTKEAFNALLKTLEEPPENVKFFFATTEPHKVLPTILSRCQRFNLNRIPLATITEKLRAISQDMETAIEDEALHLLAKKADGGLRDAESLLDQIFAFHDGDITAASVASVLGMITKDVLFELDRAGKEGRYAFAFDVAHQVFSQGKDVVHFVECLVEHFRNLILVKMSGKEVSFLLLTDAERTLYAQSAELYSKEQCLNLLDYLIEEQNKIRFAPSPRIALEALLLHIMRTHQRLPIEFLVRKLTELEERIESDETQQPNGTKIKRQPKSSEVKATQAKAGETEAHNEVTQNKVSEAAAPTKATQAKASETEVHKEVTQNKVSEAAAPTKATQAKASETEAPKEVTQNKVSEAAAPTKATQAKAVTPAKASEETASKKPTRVKTSEAPKPKISEVKKDSMSVDPTPTPEELGVKITIPNVKKETKPKAAKIPLDKQSRYDTLLQFAAVELEGRVQKD